MKIKQKITTITIYASILALASGCTIVKNNGVIKPTTVIEVTTETKDNTNDFVLETPTETPTIEKEYPSELSENQRVLLNQTITIENPETILQQLNTYMPNYTYSEYFEIDQALMAKEKLTIPTFLNSEDNHIDETMFLRQIIQNNQSVDNPLNETDLKKVCAIVIRNINQALEKGKINKDDLNQKLMELTIVDYKEFSYAYYNSATNQLGVNLAVIHNLAQNQDFDHVLENIINHETQHILQGNYKIIKQNPQIEQSYGPCVQFKSVDVNSLYWNWFIEGSAEQLALNKNPDMDNFTYPQELKALELLKLPTLLDKTVKKDALEVLSTQDNLQAIFDYFDCQSIEEEQEVLNLFYALNLVVCDNYSSTSNDFYEKYNAITGSRMDFYQKKDYLASLKESIAITESRMFYKNLVKLVQTKSMSLEEAMHLISINEDELSRLLWYSNDSYKDKYQTFFKTYEEMQSQFFIAISSSLGITVDDMKELFIIYHQSLDKQSLNLTLEQNLFYENIENTRESDHKKAIIQVGETVINCKKM